MAQYVLRNGPSENARVLMRGEVGLSTDTEELVIGLGDGKTKVISKVYAAPDGLLLVYVRQMGGFLPMHTTALLRNEEKPKSKPKVKSWWQFWR